MKSNLEVRQTSMENRTKKNELMQITIGQTFKTKSKDTWVWIENEKRYIHDEVTI